jgi:hypothetical protein
VNERDAFVKPIQAFEIAFRSNWLSKTCDRGVLGEDNSLASSSPRRCGLIFETIIDEYSTHLVVELVVTLHLWLR